ncbi:MAG: hypothetical protein Ct9H300mP1_05430 [Planctomycetaceae bacterium]|nr:MAG: hypothetical protein Ct9H300mP1_05430 [Planctomycetaceae bacterium]
MRSSIDRRDGGWPVCSTHREPGWTGDDVGDLVGCCGIVRDGPDQRAPVAGRQPLGTFSAIPPGAIDAPAGVSLAPGAGDLVVRLVHQSLVLAGLGGGPVLAVMLLVSVMIGMIGRGCPRRMCW